MKKVIVISQNIYKHYELVQIKDNLEEFRGGFFLLFQAKMKYGQLQKKSLQ